MQLASHAPQHRRAVHHRRAHRCRIRTGGRSVGQQRLRHITHGDEEELTEAELERSLELYETTAEGRRAAAAAEGAERAERRRLRANRLNRYGLHPPLSAVEIYKRHIEAALGVVVACGVEEPVLGELLLGEFNGLAPQERALFEQRARRDRVRYERERMAKEKERKTKEVAQKAFEARAAASAAAQGPPPPMAAGAPETVESLQRVVE